MKVKELITQLEKYPGEYDVWIDGPPTLRGALLVPLFFQPTTIYKYRDKETYSVWFDDAVYNDPDYMILSQTPAVILKRTY